MRTARYAGTGFLLGVTWGVVGRIWMRLISTDPRFSWQGTTLLLGLAGLVGLLLGLVHAARQRGRCQWWRLLFLLAPVMFAGAGLPLMPAVVVGGWGIHRGPLGRVLAGLAVLSAPVLLVAATLDVDVIAAPYPDAVYRMVLAVGGLVLGGTAAWASSVALGPWPKPAAGSTAEIARAQRVPA